MANFTIVAHINRLTAAQFVAYINTTAARRAATNRREQMTLSQRAATALDKTHDKTMRGIRTEQARALLAAYLDGATKMKASTVRALCGYLEMIAR